MPIQRTREEEEKLRLETLKNNIALTEELIRRMESALALINGPENEKTESKK